MYPIATSTCTVVGSSTTCVTYVSTSTPIRVQDGGDILLGLAWIVFFLGLIAMGSLFNVIAGLWK